MRWVLTQRQAEVVAKQLEHVSLNDRATAYRDASDMRAQANREDVLQFAFETLQAQDNPPDANEEIDTDWISFFYQEAGRRSAEDFKRLFGRILASEVVSPGSFSIATLQSLSRLTAQTASIFQRLCNVSTTITASARVISGPFGSAGNNALERFGLSYTELAQLVEEGLVRPDFGEGQDLTLHIQNFLFEHAGNEYLTQLDSTRTGNPPLEIRFEGPSFTRAGFQLRQVVAMQASEEYLGHFSKWLDSKNCRLFRVTEKLDGTIRGVLVPPTA